MAAGLGFKTFTTGEVLTAADTNGYLMQGILVFASEAARDAAITSPQEGQFAFTKDNNSLWYYTGSVWAASGATGDIEGVTAGTGISGGGTSGTVTITNSMATEIDAKGDLVVGTGADTFARLAVGANGTVLTAASGEATGLEWATPAGGGKVLQVVSAVYTTATTITSATYTDTGLTVSITPSAASSKVLILVAQSLLIDQAANQSNFYTALFRGGSNIFEPQYFGINATNSTSGTGANDVISMAYLDSPSTTSSTTYKTQGKKDGGTQGRYQYSSAPSSIIALEIGA
jgi:hypothetical protein